MEKEENIKKPQNEMTNDEAIRLIDEQEYKKRHQYDFAATDFAKQAMGNIDAAFNPEKNQLMSELFDGVTEADLTVREFATNIHNVQGLSHKQMALEIRQCVHMLATTPVDEVTHQPLNVGKVQKQLDMLVDHFDKVRSGLDAARKISSVDEETERFFESFGHVVDDIKTSRADAVALNEKPIDAEREKMTRDFAKAIEDFNAAQSELCAAEKRAQKLFSSQELENIILENGDKVTINENSLFNYPEVFEKNRDGKILGNMENTLVTQNSAQKIARDKANELLKNKGENASQISEKKTVASKFNEQYEKSLIETADGLRSIRIIRAVAPILEQPMEKMKAAKERLALSAARLKNDSVEKEKTNNRGILNNALASQEDLLTKLENSSKAFGSDSKLFKQVKSDIADFRNKRNSLGNKFTAEDFEKCTEKLQESLSAYIRERSNGAERKKTQKGQFRLDTAVALSESLKGLSNRMNASKNVINAEQNELRKGIRMQSQLEINRLRVFPKTPAAPSNEINISRKSEAKSNDIQLGF